MLKAVRLAIVALFLSSCVSADGADPVAEASSFPFLPETGRRATFAEAFEVVDTVVLEEDPAADVVTASPRVRFDGSHFLLADLRGQQARVYATNGRLIEARGRMGDGPGEFQMSISARRASDGRLLVTDIGAMRLTLFPLEPDGEPEILAIPVMAFDAVALDDQRYLIAGPSLSFLSQPTRRPGGPAPMLHVWNAGSEEIERSFFTPPRPAYLDETAADGEWAQVALRGDTVWAVSTYADSVFLFRTDGSRAGAVGLPLATQAKPESADDTTAVLWTAETVHLLSRGHVVVQLARKTGFRTRRRANYLVIVGADGVPLATLGDTPRLRVVADDLFYFQNPDRMEPNHWIVARWRAS